MNRLKMFPSGFTKVALASLPCVVVLAGCGGSGVPASPDLSDRGMVAVAEPESVKEPIPLDRTIGNDRRKAVFFEAFFALRQSWINPQSENGPFGGNQIKGCVVGDWNYLGSDTNALTYVQGRIGRANASITTEPMANTAYAMKGGYERTGQCLFFTVLLLRRALSYDLPVSWSSYPTTGPSAREAQPGDVVYYRNYKGLNHIGVVILKNNDGIDIVDSNFVGSGSYPVKSGNPSSEIIGRHWISNGDIDAVGWKAYKGAGKWY